MKTRILGLILMLCGGLFDLHAQNNYLLAGSKAGMEVQLRGALLLNQMKTDTSEISPSEKLWFKSPAGFSGQLVQAGPLNVILRNLTAGWMKVSVYDLTKTRLLRTVNVAPGYTEFWGYLSSENIDADKDYYWLFEDISLQTPQLIADTKTVQGDTFEYLNVLDNDKNLLPTMRARLKAGQTINPAIVVTAFDEQGNTKISATTAGTYTFLYEVVNGTTLIAEQTVTVVVGNRSEFCDLHIAEFKLKTGSNTVYVANLTSISANINPFNWKIMNIQTGATLKSGTTPPADDNLEEIDFSGLETGTYRFVISSSVRTCSDIISVSYVKPSEACNLNIVSIDKVTGTNNYTVNITYSGTTSIKYSANLSTVFGTNISANTFRINLDNVASGSYSLRADGENGKFCNASKDFQHTLVAVSPATGRLETYIKYIANYPDNWVIGGTQTRGGTRDYDTQWRASDRATNTIWQTYISDFNNSGNSTSAQASIGLQKDTARSSANVSLVVTPSKISLLQRATANASTQEVAFVQDITAPLWLRIEKTGANITAKYSKTESNTPVWTTVGTITNATTNWTTYWKNIGVGSAKTDAVTDARFRGHLGGNVAFNTAPAIIAPPVLASLTGTPTSGGNITLTAAGCAAPNITTWYKNLSTTSAGTGNSLAIVAASGDYYYATCVNGTRKSVNSNIIELGSLGSDSGTPTAPVETAEVLITLGESNAGDRVPNSYASASELGVHAKVKTVNNSTLAIESLNIGVNNALGQNDITNGTTHGWDLSIAKAIDEGTINLPQIYLVEAAQGGALLGQWNDDIPDGYFKKFEARLNAMKTHLTGKNINYTVFISLGINNGIAGSSVYDDAHFPNLRGQIYFKAAYKNLYAKIRGLLGANTKIVGTKFFYPYSDWTNAIFDELAAENPTANLFFDASNLARLPNDNLHYSYSSTKTIALGMLAKVNNFQSTSSVSAPVIVSTPTSVTSGTSVTFTAAGCTGTVTWYANSNSVSSGTSLTVSSPTGGMNYSAKCTVSGSTSVASNYIQVLQAGVISVPENQTSFAVAPPAIIIPEETEWNRFRPELLPSITIPEKLDSVTGKMLPTKWFIWDSPWRNMFGYVANQGIRDSVVTANNELAGLRRLGFLGISFKAAYPCLEAVCDNTSSLTTNSTTLDQTRELIFGGAYHVTNSNVDDWANNIFNQDYRLFTGVSRLPIIDGKRQGLLWAIDGEDDYTNGIHQTDADHMVNAYWRVKNDFRGFIGNFYFAPVNSGGLMTDALFANPPKRHAWYGRAETGLYNTKTIDELKQVVSIEEMATNYEDYLPEGYMLKDQNGNDWFNISHFGTNLGSDINYKNVGGCNARHWATQYGGSVEVVGKVAHATGHKHLVSFKPNNQINSGYQYDPQSAIWNHGKYTFEFGKWGIEDPSLPQGVYAAAGDTGHPPHVGEGAVILCMFSGADGIIHWNSAWHQKMYPITKQGNARNNESRTNPHLDRCPRDFYTYILKGQVRLGEKFTFLDNSQVSFLDLVSESDTRYLINQTEYSIDGGVTWLMPTALDWQKFRIPPVRVVVNDRLRKMFVYAQEAYNECRSRNISVVKVRYRGLIYNIDILPNNAPNIVGILIPRVSQN